MLSLDVRLWQCGRPLPHTCRQGGAQSSLVSFTAASFKPPNVHTHFLSSLLFVNAMFVPLRFLYQSFGAIIRFLSGMQWYASKLLQLCLGQALSVSDPSCISLFHAITGAHSDSLGLTGSQTQRAAGSHCVRKTALRILLLSRLSGASGSICLFGWMVH